MIATALDRTLRAAGIPIGGVAIGAEGDRQTWRINFDDAATDAQKSQAAQILAAFDPTAPAVIAADLAAQAAAMMDPKQTTFVIWVLTRMNAMSGGKPPTPLELQTAKSELAAIWKIVSGQ